MDKTVTVNGRNISYKETGSGPVIVFLHGWMASKSVYNEISEILSAKYRCISIDLPGYGKSQLIRKLNVERIPSIINKLLRKLSIKDFFLVGNSMGGAVAILYANRYPQKVKKLVLISPFVSFKQFPRLIYYLVKYVIPHIISKNLIEPLFRIIRGLMIIFFKHEFRKQDFMDIKKERVKRKAISAFTMIYQLANMDIYTKLRNLKADTLLIYGTKDPLLKISPLEPVFGVVNNIHLAVFENIRHFVFSFPKKSLSEKIDLFFSKGSVVQ